MGQRAEGRGQGDETGAWTGGHGTEAPPHLGRPGGAGHGDRDLTL